jgi:ABC-type transport system involved in multi-copper enzyme maturation permease subunit
VVSKSVTVDVTERLRAATGEPLRLLLVLVQREVRDTLRDWRMVVPIVILTLLFPALMSFVADLALDWVGRYGAPIVGDRLLPFLLMVVGFFPISFSMVIALETFVGEKERKSLEPLLATPLSDAQLYLGKTLAAMIPPLLAAYLGITVYLIGLHVFKGWTPPLKLLALVLMLTTSEGLVMVSGAVVVSSQTTSVRAANLLASFIIIPVAFLMQGEALIMFWANYDVLWWIVLFLVVVDAILVRMGIHTFNRESLLGREIDELNVRFLWRTFWGHMRWRRWFFGLSTEELPRWLRWLGSIGGVYRHRIPTILRRSRLAVVTVLIGLVLSAVLGSDYATRYPLPAEALQFDQVSPESFSDLPAVDWLPTFTVWGVLANNVRALVGAMLLSIFSFGTMAIALLMAPLAIIFFFVAQAAYAGYSPLLFFSAFVLPHGVLELPAAVIATALAVRLGAAFMSPPEGMTVGEGWLRALADFVTVFVALVLPLLALAAAAEVHVTPAVVVWAFGG